MKSALTDFILWTEMSSHLLSCMGGSIERLHLTDAFVQYAEIK